MTHFGPVVRNAVSGHLTGAVVQAGTVHGSIHVHPGAQEPVPRQLPAAPSHFTGRAAELERLDHMVVAEPDRADPVLVVVSGPSGIGKTATALWWLHTRVERFPDGQLYAYLGAHNAAGAATAEEVLDGLLRALAVSVAEIPPKAAGKAALFRSLTAGKALAVLLDDAASADQVRAALPSSPRCVVIVTSRRRLSGLVLNGSHPLVLDRLWADASVDLLSRTVGPARISAEPGPAQEVARLCAGMPIALRVVASRLVTRPHWRVARVAHDLAEEQQRLTALATSDGDTSIEAGFDFSYRQLNPATARLYRLLGVYPGVYFGADVAAAVLGQQGLPVEDLLSELVETSLLTEINEDAYRFHDLIRLHARQQAERHSTERERKQAVRTVIEWYLDHAVGADSVATPLRTHLGERYRVDQRAMVFETSDQALAWLETELPNLVACQRAAMDHGWPEFAWQLGEALWGLFLYRGHYSDWTVVCEIGVQAAETCREPEAVSRMLAQLGVAHHRLDRHLMALSCFERARQCSRVARDWRGEATALENLGSIAHAQGRLAAAIEHYRASLDINRRYGEVRGVALLLCYLGYALHNNGDHGAAAEHFRMSAEIAQDIGDHHCRAQALVGLGEVHASQGDVTDALDEMTRGLAAFSPTTAPALRVHVLEKLGQLARAAGDHAEAGQRWQEALRLYESLGDPKADRMRLLLRDLARLTTPTAESVPATAPEPPADHA